MFGEDISITNVLPRPCAVWPNFSFFLNISRSVVCAVCALLRKKLIYGPSTLIFSISLPKAILAPMSFAISIGFFLKCRASVKHGNAKSPRVESFGISIKPSTFARGKPLDFTNERIIASFISRDIIRFNKTIQDKVGTSQARDISKQNLPLTPAVQYLNRHCAVLPARQHTIHIVQAQQDTIRAE